MSAFILSLAMLGAFALVAGGLYLAVTERDRRKALLMWVAAVVLIGNVLIWTV